MQTITNLFRLLRLSYRVFESNREGGRYHRLVKKQAAKLFEQARNYDPGTLPNRAFLKVQWYMVALLFLGEQLARLSGRKLQPAEEERLLHLAAVLGISDLLLDEFGYTEGMISELLQKNSPAAGGSPIEKIALLYYFEFREIMPANLRDVVEKYLAVGQKSQLGSQRQLGTVAVEQEIEAIVIAKGGLSVVLCRAVLEPLITPAEEEACFQLGGLIQLMDDIMDLHEDGRAGIRTVVNEKRTLQEMAQVFDKQKQRVFRLVKALPGADVDKEHFLFVFDVFSVSILFNLREYGRKAGQPFDYQRFLQMDKKIFQPAPFSLRSFFYCFPKILRYDYRTVEQPFPFLATTFE